MEVQVRVGQKVKDLVTGIEGVAITRATFISGAPRIGIMPGLDKDGDPRDSLEFDETQLVILDKRPLVDIPEPEPLHDFGQEGTDKVTGFKGVIIGRAVFMNGCARVAVQPKVDKDGKTRKLEWFDETMVESKRKKVVVEKTKRAESSTTTARRGGPGIGSPTQNSALDSRD